MMNIGIDLNGNLVYEGQSFWGHALWPMPFITAAAISSSDAQSLEMPDSMDLNKFPMIFREDAFEPLSRIRRGRFYVREGRQPIQWHVYPHPAMPHELKVVNEHGVLQKNLATFSSFSLWNETRKIESDQLIILLGTEDTFTIWTVVSIEKMASREEVVVLKGRQSFGSLPRLILGSIPKSRRSKVLEMISKATEDIHRAGPESIIDRCRDAASAILAAYLEEKGLANFEEDFGPSVKKLANLPEAKNVAKNSADIIRLLHARVKPSEQEKRKLPPIKEQDAEMAIQCLGTILCELGWGTWP